MLASYAGIPGGAIQNRITKIWSYPSTTLPHKFSDALRAFFIKNPAVSGKLDFFLGGGASRWIVAKTSIKSSFIVNLSVLKASVNVLCGHDDLVDHSDHCISQHSLQIWWWWWVSVTSSTKISTIIPIGSMNAHREYCLWLTWTSEAKHELFMSVHPFNPHWF